MKQSEKIIAGLVRVKVEHFDYGVYTNEAYKELRLQMSTGDFHSHKVESVYEDEIDSLDEVVTFSDMIEGAS